MKNEVQISGGIYRNCVLDNRDNNFTNENTVLQMGGKGESYGFIKCIIRLYDF